MTRRFLSAEWRYLLMLNYEIAPNVLKPLVPTGVDLDTHNDRAYVSMVGFRFLNTRVLGWRIAGHVNFDEINLRFYVRRETNDGIQRGVVFVKEIVPKWAIAKIARWVYNEPYVCCAMASRMTIPDEAARVGGAVEYGWKAVGRWNKLSAKFGGESTRPEPDSHEEFITEHYWGYTAQRNGTTLEYRVAHPQWRVWSATEPVLDCDVGGFYGPQFVDALNQSPASAFVAEGSAVEVFRGETLRATP